MSSKLLKSLDEGASALCVSLESWLQLLAQSRTEPVIGQSFLLSLERDMSETFLAISVEELPSPLADHWRSLQTEMCRCLKLIVTDYYFWQTALRSQRPFQHQSRLEKNLRRLQGYLGAIQELIRKCPQESE